jgi:hypothetical protein
MKLDEWKKDPKAQRKLIIVAAVVAVGVLWVWYGGDVSSSLHSMRSRKPPVVVRTEAPVVVAPPPPVPVVMAAPPPPLPSPEEAMQAQIAEAVGPSSIWGGLTPRPNLGPCQIRLELTAGPDKGSYTGNSSISCANLFHPGQRLSPGDINNAQLDAVPVNAVFSGVVKDGAIVLTQTKALNFTRQGCNIRKLVLTPFVGHLDATWEEAGKDAEAANNCGGGHVTLSRTKTF